MAEQAANQAVAVAATAEPFHPPVQIRRDPAIRRKRPYIIPYIQEKFPTIADNVYRPSINDFITQGTDAFYMFTDNPFMRTSCLMTAAGAITDAADMLYTDLYAYVATILTMVFPILEAPFTTVGRQIGARLVKQQYPECVETMMLTDVPNQDPRDAIMVMAHIVLIMFKTIDARTYNKFMFNKAAAISGILGLDHSPSDAIIFNLKTAVKIRNHVGGQQELKMVLLTQLMHARGEDALGNVAGYLCGILSWTDMSTYTFIREALLLPRSPVLADPRVTTEVEKLYRACLLMSKSKHPQYFCIFNSYADRKLLERSNFPILMRVAHRIVSVRNKSANQFVMPVGPDTELIDELTKVHLETINEHTRAPAEMIDALVEGARYWADEEAAIDGQNII